MKLPNSRRQNLYWRKTRLFGAAATLLWACLPQPVLAQLAPPNDLGVSIGHIHLLVKDVVVQQKFWTEMMGGTLVANGPLSLIEFPGVFIMLRQGDPSGPPAGSTIDHIGFVPHCGTMLTTFAKEIEVRSLEASKSVICANKLMRLSYFLQEYEADYRRNCILS